MLRTISFLKVYETPYEYHGVIIINPRNLYIISSHFDFWNSVIVVLMTFPFFHLSISSHTTYSLSQSSVMCALQWMKIVLYRLYQSYLNKKYRVVIIEISVFVDDNGLKE